MPICTLMIGPPCAGKSTLIENHYPNSLVTSSDYFIENYAKEQGKTYDEVFTEYIATADDLFWESLVTYAQGSVDFIVDRTNLTKKSRARVMRKVFQNNPSYTFHAVVVSFNSEEIHKRNTFRMKEGKFMPPNILQSMMDRVELPQTSEGFYSIEEILFNPVDNLYGTV